MAAPSATFQYPKGAGPSVASSSGGGVFGTVTGLPLKILHDFADIGIHAVPGLYHTAGGLIHDPTGTLAQMVKGTYGDLTHPLDRPGYAIADIVGLYGGAGAIAGRAAAVGAALRGGEAATATARAAELTAAGRPAEAAAWQELASAPPRGVGSALLRGKRPEPRYLYQAAKEEGAKGIEVPYGSYPKNYLTAEALKLLDQMHVAHPDVRIPGVFRKQSARLYKASLTTNILLGRGWRDLPARLVKNYKNLSESEWVAARVVAEGIPVEDRISTHEQMIGSGELKSSHVAESRRQIKLLQDAAPYIHYVEHTLEDGSTVHLPKIKPEHTKLASFVEDARRLANARDTAFIAAGFLTNRDHAHDAAILDQFGHIPSDRLTASAINRRLGPYNIVKGNGLPDNPTSLRGQIASQRNLDRAAGRGVDFKSQKMTDLEHRLLRQQGQLSLDMEGGGPVFSESLAHELFRVPYKLERPTKSLLFGGLSSRTIGGRKQVPGTITHQFTGEILKHGTGRIDVPHLIAETNIEMQRFLYFKEVRDRLISMSVEDPSLIEEPYRQKLVLDWAQSTERPLQRADELLTKAEGLNRNERSEAARLYNSVRNAFMPRDKEIPIHPGVRYIDKRLLGGLDKPNPLMSAFEFPAIQRALSWIDALNEGNKVAVLYLKPSYLLPNFLGNVGLSLVQQGFLMPLNLLRSARLSRKLDLQTKNAISTAAGSGFSSIAKNEAGWQNLIKTNGNRLANAYGKLVDDPFRWSSFIHEAEVEGYKSAEQLKKLVTDPTVKQTFDRVTQRANDALINYERLGPAEQSVLRRLIFFYPWVKGSSRYGYTFAANHPALTGVTAQQAQQGQAWQESKLGLLPSWAESVIPLGGPTNALGMYQVSNPSAAAILQQPGEILKSFIALWERNPNQALTILQNLSPVDRGIIAAASLGKLSTQPGRFKQPPVLTGLQELYSGTPALKAVTGYLQRGNQYGRLYPSPTLGGILGRYLVGGGLWPRVYDPVVGEGQYYSQQQPHG